MTIRRARTLRARGRLTAKQEAFAQALVGGMTQWAAYLSAYAWNGKRAVGETRASEEAAKPHVSARIDQLRERMSIRFEWTREQKLVRLKAATDEQVAETGQKQLTTEQLRAIEIGAKLQGQNEPEKLKVSGMGSLLQKIRREAAKP